MRIFRPSLFVWLILGILFLAFFLALLNAPATTNAQEEAKETTTPEPSVTPSPTPIAHTLTIFRDVDTFTLYAPAQGEISLTRFIFAVSDKTYALESFSAFRGLPFNRLPTPICFRLTRSGASSPLPLDCASALILTQNLTNADVFWYDSVTVQDFVVLIQLDGATQGICASGQSECDIIFTPGEVTPTPTASVTVTPDVTTTPTTLAVPNTATPTPPPVRAYPCDATVVLRGSDASSVGGAVYSQPRLTSTSLSVSLRVGQTYEIRRGEITGSTQWYQIANPGGGLVGWTTAQYLALSSNCPS